MNKDTLLAETVKVLVDNGKTTDDVLWVGFDAEFHCTWGEFVAASNFNYDNGYGGAEVDTALKVVGADWWLERGEYDGSEWWDFKTIPAKEGRKERAPVEKDLRERW